MRHTADYDHMFRVRRGCNAILFGKVINTWGDRTTVRCYARNVMGEWQLLCVELPFAMGRFDAELGNHIGKHVVLAATGSIAGREMEGNEIVVEVTDRYKGEFKEPHYFEFIGRANDGQEIAFNSQRAIVFGETRAKLDRLLKFGLLRNVPFRQTARGSGLAAVVEVILNLVV